MDKNKEKTEGERETKKKEKLKDIVKNLEKERKSYEHTQIIDKLNEEFSTIKNELTKKGFESADTKEKSGYNSDKQKINVSVETLKKLKKTVSSDDFEKDKLIKEFDICIELKDKYSINSDTLDFFNKLKELYNNSESLKALHEAKDDLSDAEKYLINKDFNNKIKKNTEEINEIKDDSNDNSNKNDLYDEKNLNFINLNIKRFL